MRHNKKTMWILGVLVIGVWGVVIYQIMNAVSGEESNRPNAQIDKAPGGNAGRFFYQENVKDPFYCAVQEAHPRQGNTKRQSVVDAQEPPPFKLSGILIYKSKGVAIIETRDGGVFFVREGDTLRTMRVVRICRGKVKYFYQHRMNELIEQYQDGQE